MRPRPGSSPVCTVASRRARHRRSPWQRSARHGEILPSGHGSIASSCLNDRRQQQGETAMTISAWKEGQPHHVGFAKSRRATVLFHAHGSAYHAALRGDEGVVAQFTVANEHLGTFMAELQNQWRQNENPGSLVFGWGLVATGGLGPRPGGPPGPTGEPPAIRATNVVVHYQLGA